MKTQTIFVFTVREKINARGSHAREQARITRKLSSHVPSKGRTVKETPDYDFPQWLTWNRAWDTLKRNNFANHVVRCGHFKSAIARVLLLLRIKLGIVQRLFPFNLKDASKRPGPGANLEKGLFI